MKKHFLTMTLTLSLLAVTGCTTSKDSGNDTAANSENTTQEPTDETQSNQPDNASSGSESESESLITEKDGEIILTKSEAGNPLVGNSDTGDYLYGGDPSVLVDGDTVYLYIGHDCSSDSEVNRAIYNMPEYLCYSSKDLINWTEEGTIMTMENIEWTKDTTSAWAAQVVKHYDKEAQADKYYLYYCSWDKTSSGKQSIGVAVSDSPTGPFNDIGKPLVKGDITTPESNTWNDIDPTVLVDTDENGTEHRYLAWGNSDLFFCELNEDMISVTDQNDDGKITCGDVNSGEDIIYNEHGIAYFTEAPWLYRRKDENGTPYGNYYLFYAYGWRERMAYAMCESDPLNAVWQNSTLLMLPTATSNTNHMAVFDFQGKTYFMHHNGSLPAGNGYRRSACLTELTFNEDGTVAPLVETAAGIGGTKCNIKTSEDKYIAHEFFLNSGMDKDYPIKEIAIFSGDNPEDTDAQWVLKKGKSDPKTETCVSIQSENKPGLYLTATNKKTIVLAQDTDASEETALSQTFLTVKGLDGSSDSVSFESAAFPGRYLTMQEDTLVLSDGTDTTGATFFVNTAK